MVDHSFSNVSRQVRREGGWIYSRGDIGGWIGGYWRLAGSRVIVGWGAIFKKLEDGQRRKLRKPGVSKM